MYVLPISVAEKLLGGVLGAIKCDGKEEQKDSEDVMG